MNYVCFSFACPELWKDLNEEDEVISANLSPLAAFSVRRTRTLLPLVGSIVGSNVILARG